MVLKYLEVGPLDITDTQAYNYNPKAVRDDGSCSVSKIKSKLKGLAKKKSPGKFQR